MNEECSNSASKRGRWTKEEQDLFNLAYQWHGKDWKRLSEIIPSRTIIQIRSHAQKIQKKIDKKKNGDCQVQKIFILEPALQELNDYITNISSNSYKKYIEIQNKLVYSNSLIVESDSKICDRAIKGELN